MDAQEVLRDAGVIFGAALVAVPIAALLRVPVMIVLVAVGALVGPSVLDLVSNPVEGLGAQLVFTLGVSLILFHGGLGISLRVISRTAVGLGMLVLPGIVITAPSSPSSPCRCSASRSRVALMVGAVLAATDPAILIPLFDRLRLRPKVAQTVIAESAFNDPTGTVLALTVAGVVASGSVSATEPLVDFSKSLALGLVCGIGGACCSWRCVARAVGIWRESPAAASWRWSR